MAGYDLVEADETHNESCPCRTCKPHSWLRRLLFSELDAIQKDPSRPHDLRLSAWEEEQRRIGPETYEEHERLCRCIATADLGGLSCCDHCMDDCRLGRT